MQGIHLKRQTLASHLAAAIHQFSSPPMDLGLSSQTSNRILEASQQVSNRVLEASQQVSNRVLEANKAMLVSHKDSSRVMGASKDMQASRKASIRVMDTSNRVLEMELSSRALEASLQVSSKALLQVSLQRGAHLLGGLIKVRSPPTCRKVIELSRICMTALKLATL